MPRWMGKLVDLGARVALVMVTIEACCHLVQIGAWGVISQLVDVIRSSSRGEVFLHFTAALEDTAYGAIVLAMAWLAVTELRTALLGTPSDRSRIERQMSLGFLAMVVLVGLVWLRVAVAWRPM